MFETPGFGSGLFLFFFFFSIPFIIFALLFSLPLINRNSDPGSHSRLFPPPTHYGSCFAFLSREDFSSFLPRRIPSNCAYPRYALPAVVPFIFFQIIPKSHHGGSRTSRSTLQVIAFEGNHCSSEGPLLRKMPVRKRGLALIEK